MTKQLGLQQRLSPLTWPAAPLMATASAAGLLLSSRSQVPILLGALSEAAQLLRSKASSSALAIVR